MSTASRPCSRLALSSQRELVARFHPPINDIGTDTGNAPVLRDMPNPTGHPGARVAELQRSAYPGLGPLQLGMTPPPAFDQALAVARAGVGKRRQRTGGRRHRSHREQPSRRLPARDAAPSTTSAPVYLDAGLGAAVAGLAFNGHPDQRLPNTLHGSFPGVSGRALLAAAAEGMAAAVGSACHSEHDAVSGVLAAMGVDAAPAAGAVRLSVGRMTTADEIERAATGLVPPGDGCERDDTRALRRVV